MKYLTRGEAETKRQKAVEFLRRIGNDDLADEFDTMTPEEYAEHKGAELLTNPIRSNKMAQRKSVAELQAELNDANDYIEQLEEKLDAVASAITDEDEDDLEDEDEDELDQDDD